MFKYLNYYPQTSYKTTYGKLIKLQTIYLEPKLWYLKWYFDEMDFVPVSKIIILLITLLCLLMYSSLTCFNMNFSSRTKIDSVVSTSSHTLQFSLAITLHPQNTIYIPIDWGFYTWRSARSWKNFQKKNSWKYFSLLTLLNFSLFRN